METVPDFDVAQSVRNTPPRFRTALLPVVPVRVGNKPVIGPAHHQVADINHKGIGRRRNVDPLAIAGMNLQPAGPVLAEQ